VAIAPEDLAVGKEIGNYFPGSPCLTVCFWYVSLTSVLLAGKGTFGSINRCTPLPTFLANELCLDLARSIYVFFTASSLSSLHRTELQTQFSELIAHTCKVALAHSCIAASYYRRLLGEETLNSREKMEMASTTVCVWMCGKNDGRERVCVGGS